MVNSKREDTGPKTRASRAALADGVGDMISLMPIPVAVFDTAMRLVATSAAFQETYGVDLSGASEPGDGDLLPWLPEGYPAARDKALAGEVVQCDETRTTLPDGRVIRNRWITAPIHRDGGVAGIILIIEDISAGKGSQPPTALRAERIAEAMDAAGIALFEVDFDRDAFLATGSARQLLETQEVPDSYEKWLALAAPEDRAQFDAVYRAALDPTGSRKFSIEFKLADSAEPKVIELRGNIRFDETCDPPRPLGVVGAILDRTERARISEALVQAQRLETVGRMAGLIAHDFNNLLTVILSNLELASRAERADIARTHLERAIDATQIGAGFNQRLLALAGARTPKPVCFDLDAQLAETWTLLERVLGEQVHLRLLPGADHGQIYMDCGELDGALLNLVINARDAMTATGTITIQTGCARFDAHQAAEIDGARPGCFLTVSVTDTGQGMTPDVRRQALDPFFTTKDAQVGNGLGLTSVASSIARAGGFLHIDTAPDKGTTITLYLPETEGEPTPAPADHHDALRMGDGQLVLVVEDDPLVREAVLDRLEALGYAVIEAANASEALEQIEAGEPVELLFSDVVLPGTFSGFDLVDRARARDPALPVLLTSGHTSEHFSGRPEAEREVELLTKPYSLSTLSAAVARALKPEGPPP
ncbi:ATP-binding protein [Thioclava sp. JE_KL1]|uniref:hybrid sensor histidine kinase/response regulator n=1 Tax=Thioclava sp. JE_KL1 TaxID=2651187 RepID=UPI00128B4F3F|nr:response regulator [Thioclava sp. JE_KL1]